MPRLAPKGSEYLVWGQAGVFLKRSPGVFMGCHGWKPHSISDAAPKMALADKNTSMLLREKLLLGKRRFEIKKN